MIRSILVISMVTMLYSCKDETKAEVENENAQTKQNVALTNQFFTHFNRHDWKQMAEMYADTAYFKDPSLSASIVTQTHEQTITKYSGLNEIFPDIHDEVIQIYPSGENHVIVEFISTGTAPDESTFKLPICTIFTFENGKIAKDFTYYDNSNGN